MKLVPYLSNENLKQLLFHLINNPTKKLLVLVHEGLKEGLFDDNPTTKEIIINISNQEPIYIEKMTQNNIVLEIPSLKLEDFIEILKIKLKLFKYIKYSQVLESQLEQISKYSDLNKAFNDFYSAVYTDSSSSFEEESYFVSPKIVDSIKFDDTYNIISTGYKLLDSCLAGGFYPVRTYVFVGASGSGKSTILRNITKNIIKQNKKVFFATLEMTAKESLICFISSHLRIPVDVIIETFKNPSKNPKIYEGIIETTKYFENKLYIQEYLNSHNIFDLIRDINKIKLEYNFVPDALVIDYADYYSSPEDWASFGEVYDVLKSIGRMFNVPIITASQTNRESYAVGGETQLAHIANSMEKVKKAEVVILIRESNLDAKKNEMRLYIGKNRFGKAKVEIKYSFNKNIFEIKELDYYQVNQDKYM